jgi:hypothetical protein
VEESAAALYILVRNPLTHDLGLGLERKVKGRKVIIERTRGPKVFIERSRLNGVGWAEARIEALEVGIRPAVVATVTKRHGAVYVGVEAFYWGTRRMLQRLCGDRDVTAAAAAFLRSLDA